MLYATSRAIQQMYRPALDALGITYPQYLVMMVLWEDDDLSLVDLGARLMLDSGTLTPLIKRLAARGLVSRARDPHDERRARIRLTADGRALERQSSSVPAALMCLLGDDLPMDELARLRDQLRGLTLTLREIEIQR